MTLIIRLILILVLVGTFIAVGWYITGMKEQLAVSKNNTEKMEEAVYEQQLVLNQLREDIGSIQKANDQLAIVVKNQNKNLNTLTTKFDQSSSGKTRDIGKLARRRSRSVERIINSASNDALRCLELASGARLTEDEKYGKKVNKECPALMSNNDS